MLTWWTFNIGKIAQSWKFKSLKKLYSLIFGRSASIMFILSIFSMLRCDWFLIWKSFPFSTMCEKPEWKFYKVISFPQHLSYPWSSVSSSFMLIVVHHFRVKDLENQLHKEEQRIDVIKKNAEKEIRRLSEQYEVFFVTFDVQGPRVFVRFSYLF